jgi:aspartate/methionine/tyrosine aminotransferase
MDGYMYWAKTRPRTRFELASSNARPVGRDLLGLKPEEVILQSDDAYGYPPLIRAISQRYGFPETGVVPVPGASCGIFIGVAAVARPGDTIMVEHPVYDPIERVCDFLHLRKVTIDRAPARGFEPDFEQITKNLRAGAKALVLTNLHNPSAQVLSAERVGDLAERCAEYGSILIVDEVYLDSAHINLGAPLWTAANLAPNVIALNSLTKVYGLGGLRAGWMLLNDELADRARTIMDLLSVVNAAPSAAIATRAFAVIDCLEASFRETYGQCQPVYRQWLESEPTLTSYPSHGAIFECLKLPRGISSDRLCALLREEYDTQLTPGTFFGLPDHARISLSIGPDDLVEALARVSKAMQMLT